MPRVLKRRALIVGLVASAASALLPLSACNTPFIPIPPPGNPTFEPVVTPEPMGGTRTFWLARGSVLPGARVFLWNASLKAGVIAQASTDGSYVAGPFDGKRGDAIELRYETAKGERSSSLCRILDAGERRAVCPEAP
jgi:hypothetical protein